MWLMITSAVEGRQKIAYPGFPSILLAWILDQEIVSSDGSVTTVLSWLQHLGDFNPDDWAEWMAGPGAPAGTQYSPAEWLQYWRKEEERRPEMGYILNRALPLVNARALADICRTIVTARVLSCRLAVSQRASLRRRQQMRRLVPLRRCQRRGTR